MEETWPRPYASTISPFTRRLGPDRGSHAAHLHYAGAEPAVDQLWTNSGDSHDEDGPSFASCGAPRALGVGLISTRLKGTPRSDFEQARISVLGTTKAGLLGCGIVLERCKRGLKRGGNPSVSKTVFC